MSDLHKARVEAACKAYQAAQNADPYDFKGRMSAALAAADAHLPSVEQIAEAFAQSEAVGLRWEQIPPMTKQAYMRGARAIRSLFGEVAGDE